jgi:hypothetical protein
MTKWHKIERMIEECNVSIIDYQTSAYKKSKCSNGSCKFYYDVRKDYVVRFAEMKALPICNVSDSRSTSLLWVFVIFLSIMCFCILCTTFVILEEHAGLDLADWKVLFLVILVYILTDMLIDYGTDKADELHKKAKLFNRKLRECVVRKQKSYIRECTMLMKLQSRW